MKTKEKRLSQNRLFLPVAAAVALVASVTAEADTYHTTVLADGPAAYFRLEDAAGTFTFTNAVDPALYQGAVTYDDFGAFPKFQQAGVGSNSVAFQLYTPEGGAPQKSHIEVPYAPELNQTGPFSIEFWVRATSWGTVNRCVVGNVSSFSDGWWFRQEPGATPRWIYVQNGGGIYMAGGNITKNEWTHLVVTYDGTRVLFYANGEQKWSASGAVPAVNTGMPLCIGGTPLLGGEEFFDGNVDELAIYTKALTAEQIKLHYAVGATNIAVPPVPAKITTEPKATSAYAGRTATFSVGADGTTPLSYQWYKGNAAIAGATTDILKFTCAFEDNGAIYKVVVTNLYGAATSAPVALTVMTDLTLESNPASITRNIGSKAAFIAAPGGALPVSYQWYKGTTAISGATDQILWLSDLKQSDDQTSYYVKITNPWNSTNSESATLTVTPRSVTVPQTGYAKIVLNDDPVAFWRLDEPEGSTVAVDAAGSFDGEYTPGAGAITYAVAGGVPNESGKAVGVTGKAQVKIPWALELNPHKAFTAEIWFKPASLTTEYRDVFSSEGAGPNWTGPNGWLLYQTPDNTLVWVLFSKSWNGAWMGDGNFKVEAGQWYHMALTYDGQTFRSYLNGNLSASQEYPAFIPNGDGYTSLGFRFDGGGGGFDGAIDDVAFYNKALTLDQIQAHYNATVKVGVTTTGNGIVLTWPFGTLQQSDQASGGFSDVPGATSPYTSATDKAAKYFRVKLQ